MTKQRLRRIQSLYRGNKSLGIVNASPLIYLGKLGKLELLKLLFNEVFTTKEVRTEVLRLESAPEQVGLTEAFNSWLKIKEPQNQSLIKEFEKLQIHKGEASIIVIAKELQSEIENIVVIIDDLAAREIARTMGMTITGTIGILLKRVKEKLMTVKQCKELLSRLNRETEFRMTIKVYTRMLEYLERLE